MDTLRRRADVSTAQRRFQHSQNQHTPEIKLIENKIVESPTVTLDSRDLKNSCGTFLIDTGSTINVLKEGALITGKFVDTQKICSVTGITEETVRTIGQTLIVLNSKLQNFQLVANDFPIVMTEF